MTTKPHNPTTPQQRAIEECSSAVINRCECKWIMCPVAHNDRMIRKSIADTLAKDYKRSVAVVKLNRINNSQTFLRALARDWGVEEPAGEFDSDFLCDELRKIVTTARSTHGRIFLVMEQAELLVDTVELPVIQELRALEHDELLCTVVVSKWSREFLFNHWETSNGKLFKSSGYGDNHEKYTVPLFTEPELALGIHKLGFVLD